MPQPISTTAATNPERVEYFRREVTGRVLHLDFETFSRAPLRSCGGYRYALDHTTEVLICCWAVDEHAIHTWLPTMDVDEARKFGFPVDNKLWHYDKRIPGQLADVVADPTTKIIAHNASFERAVWQAVLVRKHGAPKTSVHQYECTAARAAAANLPRSLDGAGMALETRQQKDKEGARLIKIFCMPRKPTKNDPRDRIRPLDEPAEFLRFAQYCAQDVRTERDIDKILPTLHPFEQRVFAFDMQINERGLLIDIPLVRKAAKIVSELERSIVAEVQRRTVSEQYPDGLRPTQVAKMLAHFRGMGIAIDNMQADHVRKYMLHNLKTLPKPARELLLLRMEAGKSSTKKFASMLAYCGDDHRARGTLLYFGASTGRWCVKECTKVLVKDEYGWIGGRNIQNLKSTDMLWDGIEWVTHEGVVYSGVKEIIEHDGVEGSVDHYVYVDDKRKMRLEDARDIGMPVMRSTPWAVYCLTLPDGKRYIGCSRRPYRRLRQHKGLEVEASNPKKRNQDFVDFIADDFEFEILEWVSGRDMAHDREEFYVAKFKSNDPRYGYNRTKGGLCGPGFTKPEYQLSASIKGSKQLQQYRRDLAYAVAHDARVAEGVQNSEAHKVANQRKAAALRGPNYKPKTPEQLAHRRAYMAEQRRIKREAKLAQNV